MEKLFVILLFLFSVTTSICSAQTSVHKVDTTANFEIQFRFDKNIVDSGYMNNSQVLDKMNSLLEQDETLNSLDSILIITSSSPEGVLEHNRQLSKTRAYNLKKYLIFKHPHINQQSINTRYTEENWNGLRELIVNDPNVPLREKAISIIDSDINPGTKKWRLQQLSNGATWGYLERKFFRQLRSGNSAVIFYRTIEIVEPEEPTKEENDSIAEPAKEIVEVISVPEEVIIENKEWIKKPLFAIKSNLLYDLLTALNVELEVPIGKRWSISGEFIFPWWKSNSANWTMQLLSGHGAAKYWLGNREHREVLTGWSLGVYGGGGKYDFQLFNPTGVQGDFFNTGIQAGFAHKIGKVLRMEYSLGLGYLQSDYKKYDKARGTKYDDIKVLRYPWEEHRINWFGPTSAKVSLVWLLHSKRIKK